VLDEDHPYADAHDGQGTWLVHTGEFGKGCDVGMVSDGHGFEDSPDCERICGGINSKGPMAVAIGRQANLLQWGFYGAPDRMTESAKRAFLNAIVWMKQFAGQAPLVKKQSRGRSWYAQYIDTLAQMKPAQRNDRGQDSHAAWLLGRFPADVTAGDVDVERLRRWYADHEEFIGGGSDRWETAVDADLVQLRLSNRRPGFLDWLLERFAADPGDALALRLARRYLGEEHGRDAATATRWIREQRPFLFFSDTGGYRWFVDGNARRAAAAQPRDDGR
jgi:hypothetical protein